MPYRCRMAYLRARSAGSKTESMKLKTVKKQELRAADVHIDRAWKEVIDVIQAEKKQRKARIEEFKEVEKLFA